ncbi:hypothetical protein FB567DRAFT_586745 [Paraphoma chrysanthemicola]|uniref:Uncharacterized protein n=1 Tax=Paraphoma chrysanthemicola TaxID=798071 RepID=A0A8K0RJ41_9PLEO|nr:hypothetical protein FB567DRAFT_586745 [Paraphoma chrysanthemicola]
MRLTSLTFVVTLLATAAVASQPDPVIHALLSTAFEMVDVEGECAKQACTVSHSDAATQCTPAKINKYRPACKDVMRRAGMRAHKQNNLDPSVREKMKDALRKARGFVTEEMAQDFMRGDAGDVDMEVAKVLQMIRRDEL